MKLIVVSNRIPVTLNEKFEPEQIKSAGGLVSAISAYIKYIREKDFFDEEPIWAGWPGKDIPEKGHKKAREICLDKERILPVFLPKKVIDPFYSGICNKTIWPLFHYFTEAAHFNNEEWEVYRYVNNLFAEQILNIVEDGDIIWIHDYHLMLLPELLRNSGKNVEIGFFLHIPFPTYEVFRLMPRSWANQILSGIMGADVIGFHIHDYTQYFLRCAARMLGIEHNFGKIYLENRVIKVDTFPIGIDYEKIETLTKDKQIIQYYNQIRENFPDKKIILSVDRLDYTKGILNRLHSYERFLDQNPEWREKVILYIIVVPSRTDVEHYQTIKRRIDEHIGRINGKYGNPNWVPIIYQYRYLEFDRLIATYMASDIALVTPIRDGMNLVAKEYVATKRDKNGVLILSEMAGAAQELGEAIIVNPNNIEEMSEAIKSALQMPEIEQKKRISRMLWRIRRYNVFRWGDDILKGIIELRDLQKNLDNVLLTRSEERIINDYKTSRNRLFLIDYDGTLVPFVSNPDEAIPDREIYNILQSLKSDKRNDIYIVSGRTRDTLYKWFGDLNIGIVAEHGAFIYNNNQWEPAANLDNSFIEKLIPVFELFSDRLPNSTIEIKEYSICLHYRNSDQELAELRSKELYDYLVNFTANINVQVLKGDKVLEVRQSGINKGMAALKLLKMKDYDFIIAIGDDTTDEDMFNILPENAYSIKVGLYKTSAKYRFYSYSDTRRFLDKLSKNS